MKTFLFTLLFATTAMARPKSYTELLDYVIEAPDQGETATCLFVGSTGAMEILANKKHGLKHQRPGDRFDLAEQFLMWQKSQPAAHRVVAQVVKFNWGEAIHSSDLPFSAWNPDGSVNNRVWNYPRDFEDLPRLEVPKITTETLFVRGGKWDTYVLKPGDIEAIKQALWKHKSPILVNYNDEGFWHVITIIGYDDTVQDAVCYDTTQAECDKTRDGALYIRDSFGVPTEIRDADWFRVKGNAAFVVRLAE